MVLPLVPLVLWGIGASTGATGACFGLKGGYDLKKAQSVIREAGARYEKEREYAGERVRATNEVLNQLGACQEFAHRAVVRRFADFLRRNEKHVTNKDKLLIDGLESKDEQVALDARLGQDAVSWMRGIIGSGATGVGINAGLTGLVMGVGSASTGTAISSLGGAAATNATLAALGGGSLASGGGGMAAGAAALNVVTLGPALLVSGLVVAGQGQKARTKARENEATVNTAIEDLRLKIVQLDAIEARAAELSSLLGGLVERASPLLDRLESVEPFEPERDGATLQQVLDIAKGIVEVASAEVVDETGGLNAETTGLTMKYRTMTKDAEDV
ncbi:hypothetical protein FB459_0477 [Yimella lutea]|uniref:Uncharacterized protein n=1 Tax=Yimella lutea TaxID=587872 RepID=A0A542ECP6_9MICO|nr:hypothetical protein [Yimella lutea]TQJ13080.1 hypothetical protein FB459_0477 [Yimella lutea]